MGLGSGPRKNCGEALVGSSVKIVEPFMAPGGGASKISDAIGGSGGDGSKICALVVAPAKLVVPAAVQRSGPIGGAFFQIWWSNCWSDRCCEH